MALIENPIFNIKIDDADLSREMIAGVESIRFEEEINTVFMTSIRIRLDWCARTSDDLQKLQPGSEVKIYMGTCSLELMISGEIIAADRSLDEDVPVIDIKVYDRLHLLNSDKKKRNFNNIKYSEIAQQIAGEHSLSYSGDDTTTTLTSVFQKNQNDLEFLLDIAKRIRYEVVVDDKTLHFQKPKDNEEEYLTLEKKVNLSEFSIELNPQHAISEVEVCGWDVKKNEKISATAKDGNELSEILKKDVYKNADRDKSILIDNEVLVDTSHAEEIAKARYNSELDKFITGEGQCAGDPGLRAGKTIVIKGMENDDGIYYITASTHTIDATGYVTKFTVGTRTAHIVNDLVEKSKTEANINGAVIGIVTNNKDEEGMGRVKLKFPWLSDEDESDWARVASPMGGKEKGIFFLPEVDDEVLVVFQQGDINMPYVVGSLWNGVDTPPETNSDGKNNIRIIKSRSGHIIKLDDTEGEEKIEIADKSEKNMIIINTKDNKVSLTSEKDIEISAPNGKITISAKDLEITSSADTKVESSKGIEIKSSADTKVESSKGIEIKSSAATKVESSAGMDLKSSGNMTVKGSMVKIN